MKLTVAVLPGDGVGPEVTQEAMRVLGRSLGTIRMRRWRLHLPPCEPKKKPWTRKERAMLGRLPDAEVARRTGRTLGAINGYREKLHIKAWSQK